MPTFFVGSEAIASPIIRIEGPLLRHLKDSLRIQPEDALTVTDDQGHRYRTEVVTVTDRVIESRIIETASAPARTSPSLILAQSLLKGEKMDWVIQKATELGVDRIVPVHAKHSVVKLHADRVDHQRTRWQRIALEAAQQSERWTVPIVEEPATLPQLFSRYHACASKHILAERSTGPSLNVVPLPVGADKSVMLLIGPEGGWDQEEFRLAGEEGYGEMTLGARILRAETAAVATISIIQARLGELG
ncbi:MAG TPA: 16S rRNA (uracil(1498)-N(3))-methyltransferase [Nitrospira sp.]|nr:16S rRNA (uracil(1498)-N(3))-methyltransferase [Nitrospira sp.]